jgi:hypothetical protein
MSIPARSNIPPLAAKSFSMSTTITAVRAGSIVIGSGFASNVTAPVFAPDAGVACNAPLTWMLNNAALTSATHCVNDEKGLTSPDSASFALHTAMTK